MLQIQSEKLAEKLGHKDFKATKGWLQRLLKRRGINHKKPRGEGGSSDFQAKTDWLKDVWPGLRARYDNRNIFNTDETGLSWRMMPNGTLAYKDDDGRGFKKVKDRITILVTCSMEGEKKRPLVIGKYANPRCFKNINIKSLPVEYQNQKKAWMNEDLFSAWLRDWDRQLRAQNRRILLLLDNATSHGVEGIQLSQIELAYLPPNTTAILQPCDQGIIALAKRHYKKKMNNFILEEIESLTDANAEILAKKITLLQAIQFWKDAWDMVSEVAIKNCWKRSKLREWEGTPSELIDHEGEITFNLPYDTALIEQWIAFDSNLQTEAPTTEGDIIEEVKEKFQKDDQSEDEEEEEEDDSCEVNPVTCKEVNNALEVLNRFVMETETHENEMKLHYQYKRMIQSKTIQKLRQGKLTQFLQRGSVGVDGFEVDACSDNGSVGIGNNHLNKSGGKQQMDLVYERDNLNPEDVQMSVKSTANSISTVSPHSSADSLGLPRPRKSSMERSEAMAAAGGSNGQRGGPMKSRYLQSPNQAHPRVNPTSSSANFESKDSKQKKISSFFA